MAPATGHDDGVANHNLILISTNLDTHLAMIVSHSDTVSDFKRKVMLEHRQLFPAIGDITVESLKVKQRGIFYHLSDSMLVKSAFNAAKRNWFVSVDASRVEQNDGVQHTVNHKAGDQLALPWVTHSHGSPSDHSKIAPLVNHKLLNVDQLTSGDSCKDVLKNVKEDRLCSDKRLDSELQQKLDTVNGDISLKKRTRDVHNESSPKDGFGPGPSAKKKRKTRGKSDVKALEENLALTHVNDKLNNETTFENKTEGKDLRDKNCSANDQGATNVVTTEGVGSETVADVAMVVENKIQQDMSVGMSQKEKENELVQKPAMENEIHSSLMRTPDCEHEAAEVTIAGHMKHLTKHNTTEKEMSSTSIIKELHNTNESSPKDVKKKRKTQRIKALEKNLPLKHDNDKGNNENAFEHKTEGEDSRNCSVIDQAAADVITTEGVGSETIADVAMVVENEIQQDSEAVLKQDVGSNGQDRADDQIDKLKKDSETSLKQKPELKLPERKRGDKGSENIGEGKKKGKKKVFKHADKLVGDIISTVIASVDEDKKGDDLIMKNMEENTRKEFTDTNDVVSAPVTNDADVSITEKNTSQVNEQGVVDNLEKPKEKTDDTTKKRKKRKTKKASGRNEDELIPNIENVDIKDDDKVKEVKEQDGAIEAELESKKSQSVDRRHLSEKINNETESEVSKVNNEVDIPEAGSHELDLTDNFAPGHQPEKIASIDNKEDMTKTEVSLDVFKEPSMSNIDKMKTSKRTKKIDAQKIEPVEKKKLKRLPRRKGLLNSAFGSDDDSTINLVSKKHTPSRKSSSTQSPSSSSSSSGEIISRRSYAKKGNEGAEKNNINSRSRLKNTSIGNLLRNSSAFKKAKAIASSQVEDSESQPVDFVPESQL